MIMNTGCMWYCDKASAEIDDEVFDDCELPMITCTTSPPVTSGAQTIFSRACCRNVDKRKNCSCFYIFVSESTRAGCRRCVMGKWATYSFVVLCAPTLLFYVC